MKDGDIGRREVGVEGELEGRGRVCWKGCG